VSATDSTASSGSTGDDLSTPAGAKASADGWSDRVLGVLCIAIAIWYTLEARTFDGTAFGSGPVGPKTLPTALGVIFGTLSLYLIVKPDRSPRWPTISATWHIAAVVLSSYLYGRLIEPIGFIASSVAITVVVGLLFRARVRSLLPAALIFPIITAYIFNHWLELHLPDGWWGGF
jgi:putative tricarboxylic transport membrane protein